MKKNLGKACILSLLMVLIACTQPTPYTQNQNTTSSNNCIALDSLQQYRYIEHYRGLMPCADCPGIDAELIFVNDTLMYKEILNYRERNTTYTQCGEYTTLRGFRNDPDATVYWLNPQDSLREQFYLKINDSSIVRLLNESEADSFLMRFPLSKSTILNK